MQKSDVNVIIYDKTVVCSEWYVIIIDRSDMISDALSRE